METLHRPTRKSLPLTARDVEDLIKIRNSVAHRAALADLVDAPVSEGASEASVLQAVFEAGLRAVRHQVEEAGYAKLAAEMDASTRQASARRRRPAWADE
jgi:hypothetical protein